MDEPAFVCLLRVHLHFPDSGSLKAKRAELNRVKALLRDRVGATVAEVGHQDTWQRSTLAVAVTGDSVHRVEEHADRVERLLLERFGDGCRMDRTVRSFSEVDG